jgi:hypothetical protein
MHECRYLFVLIITFVLVLGCVSTPTPSNTTPTVPTTGPVQTVVNLSTALARFTADANATLQELDSALALATTEFNSTGITGPAANETLAQLANSSPYAVDAVTISADGRIAAAMPTQYWSAIGVYVGNESHNQRALQERIPLMTPIFPAAEGFNAVSVRRPVWNSTGTFLGLATVLLNPSHLLADSANRSLAGTNFTAWAMQTDGLLIYDRDPSNLGGLNLITDPLFANYPELVELAKRIAVEPSGSSTYTFTQTGGGPAVMKEAVWGTVGLHGTEWRLVVAREI